MGEAYASDQDLIGRTAGDGLSAFGAIAMMAAFSLVQGLPAYFFTLGLPALLRDSGVSLEIVGLTYVVWLPFAFKWLWAPAFDSSSTAPFGNRINWLRALSAMLAAVFALVAFFPPGSSAWPLLALSLCCATLGATIQLILAAWLIHEATPKRLALANAAGVAAMVLGGILGAGLILQLGEMLPWAYCILAVSAAILLFSLPAWLRRGSDRSLASAPPARQPAAWWLAWRSFLRRPGVSRMGIAIVCFGAAAGADALLPALLVDRGFSPAEAGWLLGAVATGSIIPASGAIAVLLRRYSVFAVLCGLYAFKGAVLLALVFSVHLAPNAVAGLAVADFCASGALTVATWQLYMRYASGPHSATDFSLTTSLDALLRFCGGALAGKVAHSFDYATIFAAAACAALGACLFTTALRPPLSEGEPS